MTIKLNIEELKESFKELGGVVIKTAKNYGIPLALASSIAIGMSANANANDLSGFATPSPQAMSQTINTEVAGLTGYNDMTDHQKEIALNYASQLDVDGGSPEEIVKNLNQTLEDKFEWDGGFWDGNDMNESMSDYQNYINEKQEASFSKYKAPSLTGYSDMTDHQKEIALNYASQLEIDGSSPEEIVKNMNETLENKFEWDGGFWDGNDMNESMSDYQNHINEKQEASFDNQKQENKYDKVSASIKSEISDFDSYKAEQKNSFDSYKAEQNKKMESYRLKN